MEKQPQAVILLPIGKPIGAILFFAHERRVNKELAYLAREIEPLYAAWDRMTAEMETVLQTIKSPP